MIDIGEDYVTISDEAGEIVHWIEDEWKQDPSLVFAIASAIEFYHTKGTDKLRQLLKVPKPKPTKIFAVRFDVTGGGEIYVKARDKDHADEIACRTKIDPFQYVTGINFYEIEELDEVEINSYVDINDIIEEKE